MKNVVFIMNIKLDDTSGRYTPERSLPYKYSIDSWKHWASKNNAELFIITKRRNGYMLAMLLSI